MRTIVFGVYIVVPLFWENTIRISNGHMSSSLNSLKGVIYIHIWFRGLGV